MVYRIRELNNHWEVLKNGVVIRVLDNKKEALHLKNKLVHILNEFNHPRTRDSIGCMNLLLSRYI